MKHFPLKCFFSQLLISLILQIGILERPSNTCRLPFHPVVLPGANQVVFLFIVLVGPHNQ